MAAISRRHGASLVAALAASGALACGQVSPGEGRAGRAPWADSVAGLFAAFDSTTPGCAVGVYLDDEIAYADGFGMADLEQRVPIGPGSIFQLASVSKQFTAMAMVLLEQQGEVSLDDDIRTHVPEVPDHGNTIRLHQLIRHTSGLRDLLTPLQWTGTLYPDDPISVRETLELVARQTGVNAEPGLEYNYNNTAYWLLGMIPERVTGESLRVYTSRQIFKPLGMSETHFHDDPQGLVPGGRTRPYVRRDNGDWALSEPLYEIVGAGGLYTTVEDLFAWHRNFFDPRVGGPEAIARMEERAVLANGDTLDYAFGQSRTNHRGALVWDHSGGDGGYRTHYLRVPAYRFGTAVLCNTGTAAPSQYAYRILDLVLSDRLGPPEAPDESEPDVTIPAESRVALVGWYRAAGSGQLLRIDEAGEGLRLRFGAGGGPPLIPLGDDRFRVGTDGDEILTFEADGNARALVRESASAEGGAARFVAVPGAEPGPQDLGAYAGRYWSEDVGVFFTIRTGDGGLTLERRKLPELELSPAIRDVFIGGSALYQFDRDGSGRVISFTIDQGRGRGFLFTRDTGGSR